MKRVAVIGAAGRLGAFACTLLTEDTDFKLVASIGSSDDLEASLCSSEAQLALDCTVAGLGAKHAEIMLRAGVRPVIGTSGVTPEEVATLDTLACEQELGGLIVPNFSLGICLQQRMAELAAEHLPNVEIIETHRVEKRDAPSSTSLDTARKLEAQTGREVQIHSVRIPGVLANQELIFGGSGEAIRLVHETYSLDAFGPGILAALRYAAKAQGIAHGLSAALWPAND